MRNIFKILTLLILFSSFAYAQPRKYNLFRENAKLNSALSNELKSLKRDSLQRKRKTRFNLVLDTNVLKNLYTNEPDVFSFDFVKPNGKIKTVEFRKTTIQPFKISTRNKTYTTTKSDIGVHYRVFNPKNNKELGVVSVYRDNFTAILFEGKQRYNISKRKGTKNEYASLSEEDMQMQFECEAADLKPKTLNKTSGITYDTAVPLESKYQMTEPILPKTMENQASSLGELGMTVGGTGCKTVPIYFECDFDMYTKNGSSVQNTINYMTAVFNLVQQLYDNEGIRIVISEIFVHTTPDPYASITTNINSTSLFNFATNKASSGFNGRLAHLVSTRSVNAGGIAYIDVLCSTQANFGYSNIFSTYVNDVSVYSWTVYCIAHEIGHNFGSRHTHWCGWNLGNGLIGRIDSCRAGESSSGSNACGSTVVPTVGTIMSYCHVTSSGVDFNLGFGELPGNRIRTGYYNASCLSGNNPPFVRITAPQDVMISQTLNLSATNITNATYQWLGPSSFSSTSRTPSLTATNNSAGQYTVLATQNGCNSNTARFTPRIHPNVSPPITEPFTSAQYSYTNPDVSVVLGTWRTKSNRFRKSNWNLSDVFAFTSYKALIYEMRSSGANFMRDTLFSPIYNVSNLNNLRLSFDVAHRLTSLTASTYDTLQIFVVVNENKNFQSIYKKGGLTLQTVSTALSSGLYVPVQPSSDWRNEVINLTQTGNTVRFAFVIKSARVVSGGRPSNALYIDNLSFTGSAVQNTTLATATLTVDSLSNLDRNYTLSFTVPNNHNATSYQIMDGATSISTGTFTDNTGRTISLSRNTIPNGNYTHSVRLINSTSTTTSNTIVVNVNYAPPVQQAVVSVDSTTNTDRNYIITATLPNNHNATSYQLFEGTTVVKSGTISTNTSQSITHSVLGKTPNGTYSYSIRLANSRYVSNSNTQNVVVNYNPPTIKTATISVDSTLNYDRSYTIYMTIPSVHYATSYRILKNGVLMRRDTITTNGSFTTQLDVTNESNGNYVYICILNSATLGTTSESNTITVSVDYTPPVGCKPSAIEIIDDTRTTFTYRFYLNSSCGVNNYTVKFFRGDDANGNSGTNPNLTQSQVNSLNWQPIGGSIRNGRNNPSGTSGTVSLNPQEITQNYFQRTALPLPSQSNRWFKIEVSCSSCGSNNTTIKTVFVR